MRVLTVSALALVTLAGCGALGKPSDKKVLIATCMENGGPEATCSCEAEALEKNLPPELFKKVAQAIGREKQNQLEYLNALRSYNVNLGMVALQKQNLELAQEIYNKANIKYQEGVGSSLEIVQAENDLKSSQTNYLNALYDLVISKIDLKKATGTELMNP